MEPCTTLAVQPIYYVCPNKWITRLQSQSDHTDVISDANSGPSDDWAKGVAGIPYTYTIELRDQGPVYGFLLPAE